MHTFWDIALAVITILVKPSVTSMFTELCSSAETCIMYDQRIGDLKTEICDC